MIGWKRMRSGLGRPRPEKGAFPPAFGPAQTGMAPYDEEARPVPLPRRRNVEWPLVIPPRPRPKRRGAPR